jgi:hypothetical protein
MKSPSCPPKTAWAPTPWDMKTPFPFHRFGTPHAPFGPRWKAFLKAALLGGAATVLLDGGSVGAQGPVRAGVGIGVGRGSPGIGGRPGFCRPGYPVQRGGVVVIYGGGWNRGWGWGGPAPDPYYEVVPYGAYPAPGYFPPGTPWFPDGYPRSWAPPPGPEYTPPPNGSFSSPGPSFIPPPYTPLEDALSRPRKTPKKAPSEGASTRQSSSTGSLPDAPGAPSEGALPSAPAPRDRPAAVPSPRAKEPLGYPSGPTPTGHPRTYRIQKALKEKGYYEAGIDGQFGPATQSAIRTYQIDRGLPVTGKIDPTLEKELGLSPEF